MNTDALREQIRAAQRMVAVQKARQNLIPFVRLMNPEPNDPDDVSLSTYQVCPHHDLIAAALEEIAFGKNLRLMLSVPPQHGKSTLATRQLIAWFAGKFPWKNVIQGTYNNDFAGEFGDDVRTIINLPQYRQVFPGTELRKGSKAKDHMVTSRGGKLSFLGRGGSATGRPADLLVIDDPIKDAKEAESFTIRNDVWQWFTQVLNARCHVLTAQIIIQTRWHEDDLIGRLTDPTNPNYNEAVAKQWTYLNIPAIMDNADIAAALGKKVGDALWPERFPLELLETARAMNPVAFSALHMGRPTPPAGAFFKLEQLHGYKCLGDLPRDMSYYGAGDLAVTPERSADKTCVGTWGVDSQDNLWLLPDIYWQRKAADESVDAIIDQAVKYQWQTFFTERGVIWRTVKPFMLKRQTERGKTHPAAHFHCEDLPLGGNKGARCLGIRGRMAQRKVFLPTFAPWWPAAKDVLLKFTGSGEDKEDDLPDMFGMIGNGLQLQLRGADNSTAAAPNIIKFGSWGHLKQHRERERAEKKVAAARAGW